MDMHDNDQNRPESNPSPQDLAGMMDLDLDANDPVFHRPTEHTISDSFDNNFSEREDEGFPYDDDVIDVEATTPAADPFAEEFNPEKNRTLVGLQNSGFAKAAVVVGGSFAILAGGAMIFQNQIPKSQVAQEVKKEDPAAEKISSAQAAADKAQQSESEAKAQLALAKQKDSLAQANNPNASPSNPSGATSSSTAANPSGTQAATATDTKPTNTSRKSTSPVTVNPPATVASQNIPAAQLAATGNPTVKNNNRGNSRNVAAAPRLTNAPIAQNPTSTKAPRTKQQATQVAQATSIPVARSASSIRPILSPVANQQSVAQARSTQATPVAKVPAQSITPVAAPGIPVAKKTKTNSKAAQVANASLREPQADNYRFGETASLSNSPAPATDTRRPLSDAMRNNGNNLNRDTTLAIVRTPGAQDNTNSGSDPFGNRPLNAPIENSNLATNSNAPSGGFGNNNRPIANNAGTLATAQINAEVPSSPSLTTYLQRNQIAVDATRIAQTNPAVSTPAIAIGLPVAPVSRVETNRLSTPSNSQPANIATSMAALGSLGDRVSQKITAMVAPLNPNRSATATTATTTAAAAIAAAPTSLSSLGQGIQKYQRLQPIVQVASAETSSSNNRALLSSRPAFAYTQSVAATGGIDSRGPGADRTDLPAENISTNTLIAKSILVGTSAKASTVTPILWNAGGNSGAKFIIKLEEPIRDNAGQVALPAGTQLVAIAKPSTVSAEMADLEVVGVVIQGEEFAPPAGILTIRNDQNGLIVGQDYFQRNNQIAGRDSMIFLTGALSTVGRVLNQPTNTFTSSGLNGTVTSSSNGQPNILGAVLEGGFRDLPATWTARNQQAIQEIASKPNVYQLPKGSSVRVFVNQTLNF